MVILEENVSVLIATVLAVVIIVLFPIYNVATRQDSVSKNVVVKVTTNFVDSVRNKGYIEEKDYQNFLNEIGKTGNTYDVELEVYKPILIETDEEDEYEEKYTIDYTEDILSKISNSETDIANSETSVVNENVYYLNEGYKFYVRVRNTNVTQAQVLLDRLLKGELTDRIVVNYGGMVYVNEWEKGESAETANANISISRPMNYSEKEFKYESITTTYDQYADEYTTIYGLAVRLSEEEENGTKFKFLVTYSEVYRLKDEDGNLLTEQSQREEYIKRCFKTIGFDADVSVEERQEQKNATTGLYSYKYMITLDNVNYDFDNNPLLNGTVQITSGSAETKAGIIGELNSKEFIIMYEMMDIEIKYENKMYKSDGSVAGVDDRVAYIDVNVELNKADDNIVDVRWAKGEFNENYFISNASNGTSIKNTYNVDGKYVFRVTQNGEYTVFAEDKRGGYKALVIKITGLGSDRLKFVLTWKSSYDFDLHLRGTKNNEEMFHVSYSNKGYSGIYGDVYFWHDDRTGTHGGEIIILNKAAKDMVYTFYIYKFNGGTNILSSKQPKLTVYRGDDDADAEIIYDSSTIKNWSDIKEGSNKYWYILSYDANTREVEMIDQYMNTGDFLPDLKGGV